ncbi:hypothetical protein SDC9_126839 [bioreactor metagenome]|uniref:Uncharacterized protein n=1 Tax=bioreactor metagenome TaxID=1076179 RepID=A0A645CSA1_9ZZZZ
MDAGGHQIVPGALGRGFLQHGGFDFIKALLVEVIPGDLGDFVPQGNGALKVGTAQVQIAVFQPDKLADVAVLLNFKGRGFRPAENAQIVHIELHTAGGQLGIFRFPLPEQAGGSHHILAPQGDGLLKHSPVTAIVKGQLQKTGAVPQVGKNQRAQIALPLNPAADRNPHADLLRAPITAVAAAGKSL